MEHINRHFAAQREAVPPPLLRQGLVDHLDYLRAGALQITQTGIMWLG
jgi:hypothetical protein